MKKYIKRIVKSILGMPDYSILDTLPLINYRMDEHGIEYKPRAERDTFNIEIKLERVSQGGVFEWPDMIAENSVIGKYFIQDAKTVVDIGSGVATFENIHANNFPNVEFTASDYDIKSITWCKENRPFRNVTYVTSSIEELLSQHGKYDLAITVDVIEHLEDYKSFLDSFSKISDRAVITTPNRERWNTLEQITTPPYEYHVREFNSGELYFILKMFYKSVQLYAMPSPTADTIEPIGIYSKMTPLIAYCEN